MLFDITEPVVQLLGVGIKYSGSATMSGSTDLTSALFLIAETGSSLSAESDMVSAALITAYAESSMSAQSALSANGFGVLKASVNMSAQSNLTITVKVINAAASIVIGSSDLEATSTRLQFGEVDINGASDLTATGHLSVTVNPRPMVASSRLTATVYVPSNYLVLPTIEVAYTDNILLKRYPIDNGQTLLITDNVGTLVTFAAQQDIADADYYFRGGSTNILDDEALAAVQAAGYGEYVVTQ